MENYEMPMGFGMVLAQNPAAMQKFANLSEAEKNHSGHTFRKF